MKEWKHILEGGYLERKVQGYVDEAVKRPDGVRCFVEGLVEEKWKELVVQNNIAEESELGDGVRSSGS